MATTAKAIEIAQQLLDRLKLRFSGAGGTTSLTVSALAFDTDANPYFTIGSGSAGAQNAVIKVIPYTWPLAKDVLGNSAIQYTPHIVQLATELSASAGPGTILSVQSAMSIVGQILGTGCHWDWYQSANGTAPTVSTFATASNLKGSFELSLEYPLIQLQ